MRPQALGKKMICQRNNKNNKNKKEEEARGIL
jgi:hypothetical protein